jgi:hypothetical protein
VKKKKNFCLLKKFFFLPSNSDSKVKEADPRRKIYHLGRRRLRFPGRRRKKTLLCFPSVLSRVVFSATTLSVLRNFYFFISMFGIWGVGLGRNKGPLPLNLSTF